MSINIGSSNFHVDLSRNIFYCSHPEEYELLISNLVVSFQKFIKNSNNVFVIGHNSPDLDSIGSSVALAYGAEVLRHRFLQKFDNIYVVLNDPESKLVSDVKTIKREKCSSINFINSKKCYELLGNNDLLLVTDVNQSKRIDLEDLSRFRYSMVIDHHDMNYDSFKSTASFISPIKSSASEIVYDLLSKLNITCTPDIATVILAGINLDTQNFTNHEKRNSRLLRSIAELMDISPTADSYVANLARINFYDEVNIWRVILSNVDNVDPRYSVLYVMGEEQPSDGKLTIDRNCAFIINNKCSDKILLSQIADRLRTYAGLTVAIGEIEKNDGTNVISIHVRSSGHINAGELMEKNFGGGGNQYMASAQISSENADLMSIKEKILKKLPIKTPIPMPSK